MGRGAITTDDAGVRKAAILVASLDSAAADLLLDQLGPEQARLVRQAVLDIEETDAHEQQQVIEEFRRIGPMVPDNSAGGIELDSLSDYPTDHSEAVGDEIDEASSRRHCMVGAPAAVNSPFEFLHDAEDGTLARLLADERPQTVALVLGNLPPLRAGELLAGLPPAQQIEVVRRLADLDGTDPQTLRDVEQALETRLSQQSNNEQNRAAGPQAVAKILAACDGPMRGRILGNLARHDETLAEQFGHRPVKFDGLTQLDSDALAAVLRAAGPETLEAALLGAEPEIVERFLACLPAKIARSLRRKLGHPDPIRLSDVEDARQQIAALAQEMAQEKGTGSICRNGSQPDTDTQRWSTHKSAPSPLPDRFAA